MLNELETDLEQRMGKAIDAFVEEIGRVRTGRATPNMLDMIKVDYYGTQTPVSQLASISVPDARMLVVQPYDQGAIEPIEKAIQTSDLGLTPQNDGKLIRLPIPALTEERRKEFVKLVGKQAEDAKIAVRNIRRSGMDDLKKAEKDKVIGEDEQKKGQERIQAKTDTFIKKVDELAQAKSKEILEV